MISHKWNQCVFWASIACIFGTGCSSVFNPRSSCCNFGRPPVLASQSRYVIDYNQCFRQVDLGNQATPFGKQPLTEEMFDPYQPIDPNYRLAKGDILQISIYGETDVSVENARVAPDGKIYFATLDGIQAEGRNPQELAQEIKAALKNLILDPIVTVVPKETFNMNFQVLGRVVQPGEYPIKGPVTLSEAISEAGGLLSPVGKEQDTTRRYLVPYVDFERTFISRGNAKLDVDFYKLLYQGDNRYNIYLRPGDYIYVAGLEIKDVFVLGYVGVPQRLTYIEGLTLMSALSSSGGWFTPSPYSPDLKNVIIIRGSLDCPQVCHVNVEQILCGCATDVILKPGDIVYASHKSFRFLRELVLLAINAFSNSFASGVGEYYSTAVWFGNAGETDDSEDTDDTN